MHISVMVGQIEKIGMKEWRQSGDKILNGWSFLAVIGSLTL